jgi:hypothetical protein
MPNSDTRSHIVKYPRCALFGLNDALHHLSANGFDGVIVIPVDVYPLPDKLADLLLGDSPAVFERQHLVGWWPVGYAGMLDRIFGGRRPRRLPVDRKIGCPTDGGTRWPDQHQQEERSYINLTGLNIVACPNPVCVYVAPQHETLLCVSR